MKSSGGWREGKAEEEWRGRGEEGEGEGASVSEKSFSHDFPYNVGKGCLPLSQRHLLGGPQ